jgi:hypothetical protein
MKGKLTKLMMVAMVLVMALSLMTTAFAMTTTSTVSAATDSWSRQDLPTTNYWQMAPNTDIWDLTAADDGTLFALVEDTSGGVDIVVAGAMVWDGLRWAVYPAWSDVALFKSTDGGYTWDLAWHIPSVETGAPVAVVPQPGYNDADATNDVVFVATGGRNIDSSGTLWAGDPAGSGNVYYSAAGSAATQFTRVTPQNPGVALGGWITSMDVADCGCVACPSSMMVVVGVTSLQAGGLGEGVYSWNRNGTGNWEDLQISTSMVAPPAPGTLPAGNSIDVYAVKFANWETEKGIIAVADDFANVVANPAPWNTFGFFTCFYDGEDGYWGGDVDSPTNAAMMVGAALSTTTPSVSACIAIGSDYAKKSSAIAYVGLSNSIDADDVWYVRGLATVTGPSTARMTGLAAAPGAFPDYITDIVVPGTGASGMIYVGLEFPGGQAQVFQGSNVNTWASYTPSWKPPSGGWPVLLTQGTNLMAAGGAENPAAAVVNTLTRGGVHVMVDGASGPVYNGVGLLDDIAVSEDIPGYANANQVLMAGDDWCLVEAVAMDTSKGYAQDGTIFVASFSEWALQPTAAAPVTVPTNAGALSMWRWDSRGNWERILYEGIQRPNTRLYVGKAMTTTQGLNQFVDSWTWWPRASLGFDADPYVFILGGRYDAAAGVPLQEMLWYSPDKGDTWKPSLQMPIGAIQNGGVGLSETGWWVFNNNVVFLGDINGYIYKTEDRGTTWTEGVRTSSNDEIVTIITSPIYSEGGEAGTDQVMLVGTFDPATDLQDEVWISQDGCEVKDLENVGDELNTDSTTVQWPQNIGATVVQFDPDWATNKVVYAAASGWMDRWELVGGGLGTGGSSELTRTDYTDVGFYRTTVDLYDPAASTWLQLWGADDFNDYALNPKPYYLHLQGEVIQRWVSLSGINFGPAGTVYCSFTVWDTSYNTMAQYGAGDPPSPMPGVGLLPLGGLGRFTDGGVIRVLDGNAVIFEPQSVDTGLGHYDGIWLNTVAAGSASNHVITLTYDWQEWRFKLAFFEDTLAGAGPAVVSPTEGATGVGSLMADTSVSAPISWQTKGAATLYEWQVSEDAGFSNPQDGTTTDISATVTGLKAGTTYYWRSRAVEPMLGQWSTAQQFTTVPGGETGAPEAGAPEDGATITDSTPLFTWGKVASATNYEIQVATSPTFGASDIVIDEALGDVQAYEADKELVNGTYYWRVRGTNATTDTETPWSFGSFTLDTGAEGTSTPVWVWVLIVLGVLLGIVVLVLILRTRRPV